MVDIRDRLLDAARRLLRERGIVGATTREIARAAGCADGTLFNHFRTREELFLALFERITPIMQQAIAELPLRVGKARVRANLQTVLVGALDFFREAVPLFVAVISDPALVAGYRGLLAAGDRGPHRASVPVETYLEAEQRIRRVDRALDASTAAQQLIAIAFFEAFRERFLGTRRAAAADRKWAAAQIETLAARWTA